MAIFQKRSPDNPLAALQPPARHHGGHGNEQLVLFARGEIHGVPASQFSQSRGSDMPGIVLKITMRSRRSAAPSGAHKRTAIMPFQAEAATSP